jgi:Zn-dependent M16 (insulinase) family peptidase
VFSIIFLELKGPLWEAVRGPGYAYHQSIHVNPDKAILELSLDECSNPIKAYQSTKKLFVTKIDFIL